MIGATQLWLPCRGLAVEVEDVCPLSGDVE